MADQPFLHLGQVSHKWNPDSDKALICWKDLGGRRKCTIWQNKSGWGKCRVICNGKANEGEILPTLFLQMSSFLRHRHIVVTKGKLSSRSQNYHFIENHHHLLQNSNKVHLARNFCLGLSRNLISLSSARHCVQEQLHCASCCRVSKIGKERKKKQNFPKFWGPHLSLLLATILRYGARVRVKSKGSRGWT